MKSWKDYPIREVSHNQKNYPKILFDLKEKPKKLYFRGNIEDIDWKRTIGIVGSRRPTFYTLDFLKNFIPSLVDEGLIVVSGFMYGVDTFAHQACVENGGKTIAVLASGLDNLYPSQNDSLYTMILEKGGLVVSEYPPFFKPRLWTFSRRNRILACLSFLGVIVVQAAQKSGSLITAREALKLKRKVWAIPGPLNSSAFLGSNNLIKQGKAYLLTDVNDIIKKKEIILKRAKEEKPYRNLLEEKIVSLLQAEALTADEIAQLLGKDIKKILELLSLMLLDGKIEEKGGRFFYVK